MILLIGMAVGIDYSLFYIRREREERAEAWSRDALLKAAGHLRARGLHLRSHRADRDGGHALHGQRRLHVDRGRRHAGWWGVALIGSLSILPALLAKLGSRVDKGRIPFLARRGGGESRIWAFVLDGVLRRPSPPCSRPVSCSRSRYRHSRCTRSCRALPTCRSPSRSCVPTTRSSAPSRALRRRRRWSSPPTT